MTKFRASFSLIAAMLGMAASQQAMAQATAAPAMTAPASAAPAATSPAASTAPATAAPTATVGMTVKDAAGAMVGTVTKVGEGTVTIKTDKHEAALPAASFTAGGGSLLLGMTQAQLNAEIDKQDAASAALFKVGAKVSGSAGADAGTISALDAETVTLKLPSGKVIRVPRSGIGAQGDALVIGMTAAELDAAATPATKTTTKKATATKKTVKKK